MKINKVVVFDLDDTLYNEIDYLKSAFKEIASNIAKEKNIGHEQVFNEMLEMYRAGRNVFHGIIKRYSTTLTAGELLQRYRTHKPNISLKKEVIYVLEVLKSWHCHLGILTDGRSLQQRNKIKALQLNTWFSEIVISEEFGSEKPNIENYRHFENVFGLAQYYYIGDNLKKDFISPRKLKWITICLNDQGLNIHKQNDALKNEEFGASFYVDSLMESLKIIEA